MFCFAHITTLMSLFFVCVVVVVFWGGLWVFVLFCVFLIQCHHRGASHGGVHSSW